MRNSMTTAVLAMLPGLVRVLQTMVGGKVVYDSGELAMAATPGP